MTTLDDVFRRAVNERHALMVRAIDPAKLDEYAFLVTEEEARCVYRYLFPGASVEDEDSAITTERHFGTLRLAGLPCIVGQ